MHFNILNGIAQVLQIFIATVIVCEIDILPTATKHIEVSKGTVKRRTYFAPVGVYTAEVEGE
jgi:hypothetical protein